MQTHERSPSRIDNGLVASQNAGFAIDKGRVYTKHGWCMSHS